MRNDYATAMEPVELPQRAGDRAEARSFVNEVLPSPVDGEIVELDGCSLVAVAPSYMDELVKAILVERGAGRLSLTGLPQRAADFARSAAERRHVADRIDLGLR